MKNKLTNNLSLKIISLISSILVWLIVVNINDPITQRKISNVPVRLLNTEVVTANRQVYSVLDGTDTIPVVTITGQRSLVDSLTSNDIVATADFQDMTSSGMVAISVNSTKYSNRLEGIKSSIDSVRVAIEDVKNVQMELQASTTGSPQNGYIIGDITMDENLIRVSGPESVVGQIETALVTIDVTDATNDLTMTADIRLYNADKVEISNSQISRNIDSVKVKVGILSTKTVPVRYTAMGTPANGYIMTGVIESDPKAVLIAGKTSVLNNISEIVVPETELNVTGQTADMMSLVELKKFLPEGTRFADASFKGQAKVVVYIEQEEKKELELPTSDIVATNVPEGFNAMIVTEEDEKVTLQLIGIKSVLSGINEHTASPCVDVEAYMEAHNVEELPVGTYHMSVDILGDSSIQVQDAPTVKVEIKKEEATASIVEPVV